MRCRRLGGLARCLLVHRNQTFAKRSDELADALPVFHVWLQGLDEIGLALDEGVEKVVGRRDGLRVFAHGFPFAKDGLVELHILSASGKPPFWSGVR